MTERTINMRLNKITELKEEKAAIELFAALSILYGPV